MIRYKGYNIFISSISDAWVQCGYTVLYRGSLKGCKNYITRLVNAENNP